MERQADHADVTAYYSNSQKIGNAPNDPRMTLSTYCQKYTVCTKCSCPSIKFHSVSFYDQPFSRYMHKLVETWTCTEWPQNDLKHLTDKSYPVHTDYSAPSPKSHCFASLRPAVFEIQDYQNQKCTEWPQNDLSHLTVKRTPYTMNILPPVKFHSVSL